MKKEQEIINILKEEYKDAKCELTYSDDFTLLISVVLSAQTTDKRVNEITPILFEKYPSCYELSNADVTDVENIIRPLGLYKNKARSIINLSKDLVERFNCSVPSTREELMSLSGVGRKTANVLLAEYYNYPCMPVDTHIKRVSYILGFSNKDDDVLVVEEKLVKKINKDILAKAHLYLLLFGRYVCRAKKPLCDECKLRKYCRK